MTRIMFEVISALNKKIKITENYWNLITKVKHPIIQKYENEVKETLRTPDKIRLSRKDNKVFLYYKKYEKYYVCVLAKHLNGNGFIISAYLADKIKKGETIWPK